MYTVESGGKPREKVDMSGTVYRESPDWNDDDLSLCHISIVLEDAFLAMRCDSPAWQDE